METHWQCGGLLYPPKLCVLELLLKENWAKTCLFERGPYHLPLLNFPQKEAHEYLFEGLLI